ncbi:uncharacterized protein BJ171DRAFT_137851 [Polychytrium aggregatum]|uniref:uncharacterized protein n=1 Tax=Polychytrium aggregatum TaxID=110093 RepID=UPI0022FE51D4|nr:uncharacterized protein BJ171DRAFT_137851 [Polychytrium aggregatum]KAI9203632.1 hypothetical protein BJ171DRAFT_137851 [Polychytrium aggregatum]
MRRNLMNAQSMSYLEAAELEIAANKAKGKKGERKHQLTDETALQYNLVNTDLASLLNLKKHADTGDEDADEPDESLLLSQGDLGIVDPILQSHPRFVRRKTRRPVITKIPPRKRYLQPSKIREEHLTSFNYSSVDEQFLPSFARKQSMFFPPTQVDHFGESIQTVFSDTKMVVRSMDSRVSGRMPQGFITLSVEPASEITDFGQDLDSNLKENLDERLTQYKEVEELYDEIMKTVVGSSYWEGEEAEQDSGIITPAAPFDNALTMSYAYQGLAPPPPTSHQDIEAEQISRATNISERREHFGSEIALGPLPNQKPKYDDTVRANINGEFDTPEVRMNPRLRDVMVQPDDFINDRMLAMKKTPSSKYGVFKYNYGGYIPFDFEQRRQMHNVPFGPDDYLGWLRSRACDFVADLLIDDLDDEEKFKREMEEQRRLQKIKEETERVEKFKLEKVERRKRLLHFEKGMWNPGIIEYMEEIRESDGDDDVPAPKSFTPQSPLSAPAPGQPEIDLGTAGSQPGDKPAAEDGAADQDNEALLSILDDSGSDSEPGDEDKERHQKEGLEQIQENGESEPNEPNADQPLPTPADGKRVKFFNQETFTQKAAEDNVGKIQGELERLWRALYMPLDQKLDMAIKYGSHKFISKLETALKLWRSVSEHIQTRETLLIDIEAFERTASDPARFFRRGHDGSSEARLAEARAREDLMRKLHYVEARIHDVVSLIKLELNETVTYKGAPYIEKMKYDYTEILQKVAQEREERERQQRAEATPSPSKSPFGRSMSRPSRK